MSSSSLSREQAMRKVLACLRLSRSTNPHEAAAALRQARALMHKYGFSEGEAVSADIASASAPTRGQGAMVPNSIVFLARIIADGYRCRALVDCYRVVEGRGGKTCISFYGHRSDAQVSAYAFTVLRRQMETHKSAFLLEKGKKSKNNRTASKRAQLGEMFALGWVSAVRDLFPREEVSEDHASALSAAIAKLNAVTQPIVVAPKNGDKSKKKSRQDIEAQIAGFIDGSNAKLHRGVGQEDNATGSLFAQAALEHHP